MCQVTHGTATLEPTGVRTIGSVRTLLVASGGGHLSQLHRLRPRIPFETGEVTWFTEDSPQSRSLLAGEDVVFAVPAPPRDLRGAAVNLRLATELVRRRRFDAAVSTGASVAVSTLPVAAAHGARSYYIESSARVAGPSLSGRILRWTPRVATYCQYRHWAGGPWTYAGSVVDAYRPGPERAAPQGPLRVVVTVGSQKGYPFERLVARLVEILGPDDSVVWQTGATPVEGLGIDAVVSMPAAELAQRMADADVVVAHAGVGSALAAFAAGAHPILVPRLQRHGEHVDDHQLQIAAELQGRGLATWADVEDLDESLLRAAARRSVVEEPRVPALVLSSSRVAARRRPAAR